MNIKEELTAVTKWLTSPDVSKRLREEQKTALLITDSGDHGIMISGALSSNNLLSVTHAFISAMLSNLDDEDDQRQFKAFVTNIFCKELIDEYMKELENE